MPRTPDGAQGQRKWCLFPLHFPSVPLALVPPTPLTEPKMALVQGILFRPPTPKETDLKGDSAEAERIYAPRAFS